MLRGGAWTAIVKDDDVRWSVAVATHIDPEEAKRLAMVAHEEAMESRSISATLLRAPIASPATGYDAYLDLFGLLGGGFVFQELVRPDERHLMPPVTKYQAMIPTLALAHLMREEMRDRGARGLEVRAAYRLEGGASSSRHIRNAALDLDLLDGDDLGAEYLRCAASIYRRHAHLKLGIGSYHRPGTRSTRRVHIDTGSRWRRTCWQYNGSEHVRPPSIAELAAGRP